MQIVRDTEFEVVTQVFPLRPPTPSLSVVVKATYVIEPGESVCAIAPEQIGCQGDVFHDDDVTRSVKYTTDFALIKPRAECYLVGTCHPAGGRATRSVAGFRVGSVSRTLTVYGDRFWRPAVGAGFGDPLPFESMPLCWERSFGGPGFARNPVGRGLAEVKTEHGARVPLPNLEDGESVIQGRGDRPEPAGCFPLAPGWAARAARVGTYDERWFKHRWPWFAEDFDVSYFNACPPAQQIAGSWRGDEEIYLQNLVPGHPHVTTRLPGLRARAFLVMTANGAWKELPLLLDTILVDADAMRVACTWRALVDVVDETLADIAHVFVTHERLTDRFDLAHHRAQLARKLSEADEDDLAFEAEPVTETLAAATPTDVWPAAADDGFVEDAPTQVLNVPRSTGLVEDTPTQLVTTRLAEAGLPLAPPMPIRPAAPTAVAVETTTAQLAAAGVVLPAASASILRERAQNDAPPAPTPAAPTVSRADVERRYGEGASLAGMDLSQVDLARAQMPGADFAGSILRGAVLRDANFEGANFDGAVLVGADFTRSRLAGASFKESDLTEAQAVDADFTGANLQEAVALDADFTGATFKRASLARAEFTNTKLERADLSDAMLERVDLSRCKLAHAVFTRSVLSEAELSRAEGTAIDWSDCDLTRVRATDGVRFPEATLRNARADFSLWMDARLDRANFTFASLERADFTGASLVAASLHGCNLRFARFRSARLVGVGMNKSDASEAVFESADLSHGDLRGTNFHTAAFWRAKTESARFDLAVLSGTLLDPDR